MVHGILGLYSLDLRLRPGTGNTALSFVPGKNPWKLTPPLIPPSRLFPGKNRRANFPPDRQGAIPLTSNLPTIRDARNKPRPRRDQFRRVPARNRAFPEQRTDNPARRIDTEISSAHLRSIRSSIDHSDSFLIFQLHSLSLPSPRRVLSAFPLRVYAPDLSFRLPARNQRRKYADWRRIAISFSSCSFRGNDLRREDASPFSTPSPRGCE